MKRLALEMGGKSASIVLEGADVAAATRATVARRMANSGQTCAALTRLVVARRDLAQAEDAAREAVTALIIGDPTRDQTAVGPLISADHRCRVDSYLDSAEREPATIVAGPYQGLGRQDAPEVPRCAVCGYELSAPFRAAGVHPECRDAASRSEC
jgi:acyl-CoA reductase-like NAD-dependent aldehyde dehydrogenase